MSTEQIIDNQEPQEDPKAEVVAAPEGEQHEAEQKDERTVPYGAVKEARAKNKALREELEQMRIANAQMQGYLQSLQQIQQQPNPGKPNYDPEVYALIKPIIDEEQSLTRREIQQLKQQLEAERALRTLEQKKTFVLSELPFLDEIRDELAEKINDMSHEEREAFENSPVALVTLAKSIYAGKGGKAEAPNKAMANARAKSVSGSAPASRHTSPGPVDPLALSREDFEKKFGKGWF